MKTASAGRARGAGGLSSPAHDRILNGLARNGGSCHYVRLAPVCYGVALALLSASEQHQLHAVVRGLHKRGMLTIDRRWGIGEYGQPGLVRLTGTGLEHSEN